MYRNIRPADLQGLQATLGATPANIGALQTEMQQMEMQQMEMQQWRTGGFPEWK